MVRFIELVEDLWRRICFREVPRATRCQNENEAYPKQPVSILSKTIVYFDYFWPSKSIRVIFKRFWRLFKANMLHRFFQWIESHGVPPSVGDSTKAARGQFMKMNSILLLFQKLWIHWRVWRVILRFLNVANPQGSFGQPRANNGWRRRLGSEWSFWEND